MSDRGEPNCGVTPMRDSIPCIVSLVCLNERKGRRSSRFMLQAIGD